MTEKLGFQLDQIAHVTERGIVIAPAQHLAKLRDRLRVDATEDVFEAVDFTKQRWQDVVLFEVARNQQLDCVVNLFDGGVHLVRAQRIAAAQDAGIRVSNSQA